MKLCTSIIAVLICSLAIINYPMVKAKTKRFPIRQVRSHWLTDSPIVIHSRKDEEEHSNSQSKPLKSVLLALRSPKEFKGCIDPSEPFQCPNSQHCIALHFICDGQPGDCPENFDEKEETCIAARRPAKENLEKFFQAEYTLHGSKFFAFLFGKRVSKLIQENSNFWFESLASAFSVSKTIEQFGVKMRMSTDDLLHLKNVMETIHEGRLEDIPMFAQEAINQGLASLIEKLYGSGFMGPSNE